MKAIAVSVWIFINLVFFGMCGYIYLLWSQYWHYISRHQRTETYVKKVDNRPMVDYFQMFSFIFIATYPWLAMCLKFGGATKFTLPIEASHYMISSGFGQGLSSIGSANTSLFQKMTGVSSFGAQSMCKHFCEDNTIAFRNM